MSNFLGNVVGGELLPIPTPKQQKKKHKKKRRNKITHIPKMTYREYMGSAYWKKRKQTYFSKHGKKCAVCEKKYGVTLHHVKYVKGIYGKEPDENLVPLCGKHHHEFHEHHETKSDMKKETYLFIEHTRQVLEFERDEASFFRNL